MEIKIGDKVTMLSYVEYTDEVWYTVVEVDDECVKLKHPEVGGHFTFKRDRVDQIVSGITGGILCN